MSYEVVFTGAAVNELQRDARRRELVHLLAQYDCEVTFVKVDGTLRTMPCTLRSAVVPPAPVRESSQPKAPNLNTLSVWCLDKSQWRSFRVDNVVEIRVLDEQSTSKLDS